MSAGEGERGDGSVSLVIIAPVLVFFVALLLVAGRIAVAGNAVQSAAHAAARDASLSRDAGVAQGAAQTAAVRSLDQQGVRCASTQVAVDTSGLVAPLGQPGAVSATVTCVADLSSVGAPGLPGSKTLTATGVSPVDQFRQR